MTKGRSIAAESMSNLLEVMHTQQWSGMLRVEYPQGGYLEEGEIYVLVGQPIFAQTGRLTGHEALKHLLSWQKIHFSFDAHALRPKANLTATHYLGNRGIPVTGTHFPTPVQTPVPRFPSTEELNWRSLPGQSHSAPPTSDVLGIERLVPQKTGLNGNALSLPLSRHQRHIYFMVDGRRTISDLARCINKTVPEVEAILSELKQQDLVEI
jgi:hypothetical protein